MTEKSQPKFDNPNLSVEYPELHHYTTESGLAGILASKTLWATHFSDLNDSSEVSLIKQPLERAVNISCKRLIVDFQRRSLKHTNHVFKFGGPQKVADHLARGLVNSLYQVTLDDDEKSDLGRLSLRRFALTQPMNLMKESMAF